MSLNWIGKHFGVVAGLVLGGLAIVVIVLSNVVFPSTESDSEYTAVYLMGYAAIFLVFAVIGFVGSGTPSRIGAGARAGAVAALLATAIGLATFFVVDNLFLAIVGQQVDKIQGFQNSPFRTMRDYVNAGLVYAVLGMLPVFGAAGAAFGALGRCGAQAPPRRCSSIQVTADTAVQLAQRAVSAALSGRHGWWRPRAWSYDATSV